MVPPNLGISAGKVSPFRPFRGPQTPKTLHLPRAVRLAQKADLPALAAIEAAARPGGNWAPAQVAEELCRPRATVLVDERDGGVAGWIVSWTVVDEIQILQIAVAPAARRRGVATALLRAALGPVHAADASVALLEVRASNAAAIGLYEKEGFVAVGRRRQFYSDGEDAVLMNRQLSVCIDE